MKPHSIFIHCTATRDDFMAETTGLERVSEIRHWHTDPKPKGRGWSDIGYHKLIDRDGTIYDGRPEHRQGAHVRGYNKDTLAVALFGGHGSSENDAFADNFTPEQDKALRKVIRDWKADHPTITKVRGHNEVAAKACPGFQVSRWIEHKPPKVKTPANSTTIGAAAGTAASGAVGVFTALGKLDPTTQAIVAVCACLALMGLGWIARERIKKMVAGH